MIPQKPNRNGSPPGPGHCQATAGGDTSAGWQKAEEMSLARHTHPERRDQMRQTVSQVGVVAEGVIREEGGHGRTRPGSVEHQHQHCNV